MFMEEFIHKSRETVVNTFKYEPSEVVVGVLRLTLGWIFLWSFLDKLLGLGFATTPENAWIVGGSPTYGYINFATNPASPFAWIFSGSESILGQMIPLLDIVFMGTLLIAGVTLILGIFVRIGSLVAIIFMLSVWAGAIPLENNPIVDEHIVYT
ncbi:MAG: hypothetical protein ACFFBD_28055, partial [Candidatus Hodarchaeota archaeon]